MSRFELEYWVLEYIENGEWILRYRLRKEKYLKKVRRLRSKEDNVNT